MITNYYREYLGQVINRISTDNVSKITNNIINDSDIGRAVKIID